MIDRDAIEERAAIMEYDGGLTRTKAQDEAARLHGFKDWDDYERTTNDPDNTPRP